MCKRLRKKKLSNYSLLAIRFHLPAFLALTLITLVPLLYTFRLSFYDYKLSEKGSKDVFIGLQNYITLFGDEQFLNSLFRTFVFMICAVALEVAIGILLALALNAIPKVKRLFTSMILIPMMVAPLVIG